MLVLNHLKFSLSHEYRNGLQHVEVIATFPRILTSFFVFFFIKTQCFAHQVTTEVAECIPGPTMHLRFLRSFATLDFCKIICDLGFFVRLFVLLDFCKIICNLGFFVRLLVTLDFFEDNM